MQTSLHHSGKADAHSHWGSRGRQVFIHQTCLATGAKTLAVAPAVFGADHIFDPLPELSQYSTEVRSDEPPPEPRLRKALPPEDQRVHDHIPRGVDVTIHQREKRESHRLQFAPQH